MAMPKESRVIILGAGAWGLSTAMHMMREGYSDITVLDRAESIPSPHSAACDLNKIVRAEYEDPFYTQLALDAVQGWKTALFGPYFHQTGYVVATTARAPQKANDHMKAALASIESHPAFVDQIRRLESSEAFRQYTWQYTGPLTGFTGYYNRLGGYAHSSDALRGVWQHCARNGVKFLLGESAGRAVEILRDGQRCVGVKTADGETHRADLIICALGAYAASLIPSAAKFVAARSWSVAHVQLTEEEADWLRGIPTTNVRDLGFFFEPDPKTRLFKLCPLGTGYTNANDTGVSLPPADRLPPPQDFIPYQDEQKLRQLLCETFPWMADRPFVEQKLCWFADTQDSEFCIDFVPDTDNSLVCLSGDSGHGFKMMPVFGKWVVELLAAGEQSLPRWRFRTGGKSAADWGHQVSWRIGKGMELCELIASKDKLLQARL